MLSVRVGPHHPTDGVAPDARALDGTMATEERGVHATDAETEAALVLSWRFEVLARAGYSRNQALLLARHGVDLHMATELLERGCPVETALEILL